MKLIDLLTNREIRSFALRGELNTEQISFPPGKEDYLYDQIAKAAWDRAKEIFFKEPGLILAYNKDLYDKYDYIYDDLAPQLNQDLPPSLGAKIKGVIKKIGIKRINSEGIEPVINRLAVGILEGLESKTGVYGKTLSDSLNYLGKTVTGRELEKTIDEGLYYSTGIFWDILYRTHGYEVPESPESGRFWEFVESQIPSDTALGQSIKEAALKHFAGRAPTKAEVWGWMDNYVRDVLYPSVYNTFYSQEYEGWKPKGATK